MMDLLIAARSTAADYDALRQRRKLGE